MNIERVTVDRALAALAEAVAEKGEDYVYPRPDGMCVYVVRDLDAEEFRPSCIAGNALVRLGVPIDVLADQSQGMAVAYVMSSLGLARDPGAFEVLEVAQKRQDKGDPWGEAVAAARLAVPNA